MTPASTDPVKRARQLANLNPRARCAPPGNRRAVRHGGYARVAMERMEAKVMEVFVALSEDVPLKERGELPGADAAIVRLCAECLCRAEDVSAFLTTYGIADAKGSLRVAAIELEGRLRREAADHLASLGATPRSRAKLGLDIQMSRIDVASALSEPDPIIREQLLRRAGLLDEGEGSA
jgi:hypothetical protein